ncbi:putative disease resistance protein At1g59780 [Macadamia integrifolia]|uniref:putative disease resistance protein At1g59780 n=1 Tax=Macadamia integrifolia TaxID=60698 RepID=UPI001C4E5F2E|nr:putative disease resistance protein At1g59780 [Macadamia integrifolia]
MAESVVFSVARYLGGLLAQEAEILGGVANQIVNIKDEMLRMQCFLKDADARQDESDLVGNWVSEIRELAYDVEDAIDSYILKAKAASFLNPKKYIRLHKIGKEIEMLQSKIQAITRSVSTYGFIRTDPGQGTSSTRGIRQQLRQSCPHYDDGDVIGIEDNINVLIAELINKEGPHLVSIVGMGGLGKTTLAIKVYNHNDVKRHFDCCAWSFISQQYQGRAILQEIIRKVGNQTGVETLNDGELKEKLYKQLEDKLYLLVLDDIWSKEAWDVLKPAFPKGKKGSKIMLTTRIKDVTLYADPSGFLQESRCLTEEQSWELFCKKAFLSKNVASSSSSLYHLEEEKKKLGRDMVKKCGGLPLAVVVLGGLLATKKSIHEWETVAKDIIRYLNKVEKNQEQYGVSWILSLSYHDLPSYLKSCFLYFSLYPEDTEVHKKELIQMWIAEDFVQHNGQETTKEEMGEQYLLELINRSMVQVGERSSRGKVKTCRLHDLMRDFCLWKAKQENFLCTFGGGSSTGDDSSSSSTASGMEQLTYCSLWWYGLTQDNKPLRMDGLKNLLSLKLGWGKKLQLEFALPKLVNLRTLVLHEIDSTDFSDDYDWSPLSHCRSLWKLYLFGGLRKLPKLEEFPPNLKKLKLNPSHLKEDPIPTLKTLPNLESLTLAKVYFISLWRARVSYYGGHDKIPKYYFPIEGFGRLQYLRLYKLELEELEVEEGALPCLLELRIERCYMLRMLPEGLRFITALNKMEIISMPITFYERVREYGEDWPKIQHIPSIIMR